MRLDPEIFRRAYERSQQQKATKKARTGQVRASAKYRAIVNIDFTGQIEREYQRLIAALMQIGWKYLETSALAFEGDLPNVLVAMELISKQCQAAGTLSALTFHIQGATNLNGKPYSQAKRYRDALNDIRKKQLPEPIMSNAANAG